MQKRWRSQTECENAGVHMENKEIAKLAVFIIFGLPLLLTILFWTMDSLNNPNLNNIAEGVRLTEKVAIPWWIGIIEWLIGLPGLIGAIMIFIFVFFLKCIGEIK